MIWIARVGVTLAGLFSLAMGLLFWADPAKAGAALGLAVQLLTAITWC